jgi:hypothetical protein
MVNMGSNLQNCECGSSNLEVEWEEFEEGVGFAGSSVSYLEYYVECYDCGATGKSAPSYDLAVRNWNKDCTNTELQT